MKHKDDVIIHEGCGPSKFKLWIIVYLEKVFVLGAYIPMMAKRRKVIPQSGMKDGEDQSKTNEQDHRLKWIVI